MPLPAAAAAVATTTTTFSFALLTPRRGGEREGGTAAAPAVSTTRRRLLRFAIVWRWRNKQRGVSSAGKRMTARGGSSGKAGGGGRGNPQSFSLATSRALFRPSVSGHPSLAPRYARA